MADAGQDFRPEFTNLVQLMRAAVERYGDRPLFGVHSNGTWDWKTYREFGRLVDHFRSGLASLGVGRGDKVAVISNNRLEWAVGAHATYGLGASYVPMYEAQLDKEWQYILSDSGAKVCLVASAAIARRVDALRPSLPSLRHIIDLEGEPSDRRSYAALLGHGESHPVHRSFPMSRTLRP